MRFQSCYVITEAAPRLGRLNTILNEMCSFQSQELDQSVLSGQLLDYETQTTVQLVVEPVLATTG